MAFGDIFVPVLSVEEDEPALAAAEMVAAFDQGKATVTAALVEIQPDPVYISESVMVGPFWQEVLDRAQKQFGEAKALLDGRARLSPLIKTAELSVLSAFVSRDCGARARLADLTVMLRPGAAWLETARTSMFEGVLFGSGRPVLVVPPAWPKASLGRNVVVGWNDKREAARALADATPFLERAGKVTVVTVNAGRGSLSVGAGADVCAHLSRKGISASSRNIDDMGVGEAEALFAEAVSLEADLVVMGGYGRSRFSEFVFGGATRFAIGDTTVPILMSH